MASSRKFLWLDRKAKLLRSRLLRILAYRCIYEELGRLISVKNAGKKQANLNARILNKYLYFFLTIKESTRCYLLLEIAKFFDDHSKALSIEKVLSYIDDNLDSLRTEDFIAYHKGRYTKEEPVENYVSFSKQDVVRIRSRIARNKTAIDSLIKYRNKFLAHDDITKVRVSISTGNVRTLINIIRDTVDLLYLRVQYSSNDYRNFDEVPTHTIKSLFSDLVAVEKLTLRI